MKHRLLLLLFMLGTVVTAWAETVSTTYVKEDGTTQTVSATVLTGSGTVTLTHATDNSWFVVNSDLSLGGISCSGFLNLILADGKTLTLSGGDISNAAYVNIYGQTNGTGKLIINSSNSAAIQASNEVKITGCIVEVKSNNSDGIRCGSTNSQMNGTITINGGQVSVSGGGNGKDLRAEGNQGKITLGWRKHTDYIKINNYSAGSLNIQSGQTLYYTNTPVTGHVSNLPSTVTLRPFSSNDMEINYNGTEYTIKTAEGWNVFCEMLAESAKGIFTGKIVKLAADIEVTRKAGSDNKDFTGIFDGQEHTLTFNHGSSDEYTTDLYAAPFSYITNTKLNPSDEAESPATIRNLHVTGNIYTSAKYAAGIVGRHWGTLNIKNCRSSVVIHSKVSGDGTHGGIEAVNSGTLSVDGCLFDGKILTTGTTATTNCGGFVGWGGDNASIVSSLYAPATTGDSETEVSDATGDHPSETFVRYQTSAGSLSNCFYTRTLGAAQGKQPRTVTAGEYVTVDVPTLTGDTTIYSVSGITAYSGGGLEYNDHLYYGKGDTLSLTLGFIPSPCYEGNGYKASAGTLSGDGNPYSLTMPDKDVTVSATYNDLGLHSVALTIAGCSESKIYDGTPLIGNRFVVTEDDYLPDTVDAGQFVVLSNGDTLRVTLSSGSITKADTLDSTVVIDSYTIRNGIDYSCHYNITIAAGSLTVTPQPVVITVNDVSKEYGDADPEITGNVTGLINEGDLGNIEYYKTNDTLEQIGNYPDTLSASYTPNPNYAVTIDKGDLTINCRNIITRISQGLRDTTGIDACFSATNTSVLPDADSVKTLIDKNVTDIAADEYSVEIKDVAIDSSSCNWKWKRTYTITSTNPVYCPEDSMVLTVSGGDQTDPVRSGNWVWTDGIPYQNACLASFNIDLYLPQDQDMFDDCSPMTITHTDARTGDDHGGWTIRRDYEVTDACGHTIQDFVEVSGRDQTPPEAYNTEVIKDTIWAYTQCLCDSIHVINDFNQIVSLFGLSDECTGDNISLVSKTRTFKAGVQGSHFPDTVVVAYTVADPYGNANTFYHAQVICDTVRPTFDIVPKDTALCLIDTEKYEETVNWAIHDENNQIINRVANIHDNCTRLPGSFTVRDSIDLDNCTVVNGIRQYEQYWTVTDSCGNAFTDKMIIKVNPLPTIRIDTLGTQTIIYGEMIQDITIHNEYSTLSVTLREDGLTFNSRERKVSGWLDSVGTYIDTATATSIYGCGSVDTVIRIYVNPRPITIAAGSATKKYDGTPLTSPYYECTLIDPDNRLNGIPILNVDTIAGLTITGSQTDVGSSANVASNAVFTRRRDTSVNMNSCYAVTYGQGTLSVTTNDTLIRVVPGSGSKIYDGTTFTLTDHDDFTVTGVPDGLTWTATADGTVTNPIPGEGEKTVNAVTSFHIFDADGKDVTSYFTNIDLSATGTLSIKQGLPAGPGKTGEYWATVYHQAYGYEVDENTHIYIASLTGTVLTLRELTNDRRIPGDHAVVLKSDASPIALTVYPTTTSSNVFTGNDLQGVPFLANQDGSYSANPQGLVADGTQYVLSGGTHGAGFYKMAPGYSIPSGKAYLIYTGPTTAPDCFRLEDGEEISTGLILIPAADQDNRWPEEADGSNAGRKFIMNRRLYILRDGIIYDVLGNQVKSYQTY